MPNFRKMQIIDLVFGPLIQTYTSAQTNNNTIRLHLYSFKLDYNFSLFIVFTVIHVDHQFLLYCN